MPVDTRWKQKCGPRRVKSRYETWITTSCKCLIITCCAIRSGHYSPFQHLSEAPMCQHSGTVNLVPMVCKESQTTVEAVCLSVQLGRQFKLLLSWCTQISPLSQTRHLWGFHGGFLWVDTGALGKSRAIFFCFLIEQYVNPCHGLLLQTGDTGQSLHTEGEFVSVE